MTDLATIIVKRRAGLPLTDDEVDALLDIAVPRLPFAQARALRRRLIFEAIRRHFPLRPGERSWWSPAMAFHRALRTYAPGDWSSGQWGNDYGNRAACPHKSETIEADCWEILRSAPLDRRMPNSTQGFMAIMDEFEPIDNS